MIKYKAKPMQSLYKVFKKTEVHILVLEIKLQIDKEYDLKVGYKVFKSSQTLVAGEQNTCPQSYEILLYKNQFF